MYYNIKTAEEILSEASTLYKNKKDSGSEPNCFDYEFLVKKMHHHGIFGYEYKLADVLHL